MTEIMWTKRKFVAAVVICVILAVASIAFWQMNQGAQAAILEPHAGLVGWWRFDESVGSVAEDSSGYGNDGTVYGATSVNGKYGKALNYDGNDYVKVLHSASLALTTEVTNTAWIKFADTLGYRVIVRKVGGNWVDYGFHLSWGDHILFCAITDSDNVLHELPSTYALTPETMYFVAFTYDGSTLRLYINGILNNSLFIGKDIKNSALDLYVGSHAGTEQYFHGIIDEVRIYNRALSADEIQADFQKSPDFSSKLLAKVPKGTTQVIVTLSWQGIGNINVTVQSPSVNYTEDNVNVPVYQKTVYSTSDGTSNMLNIKRLSVSVSALSSDQNWYVVLTFNGVDAYQITVEVQK